MKCYKKGGKGGLRRMQKRWMYNEPLCTWDIALKAPVFPNFSPLLDMVSAELLAVLAASSTPSLIFFPMSVRLTSSSPWLYTHTHTHLTIYYMFISHWFRIDDSGGFAMVEKNKKRLFVLTRTSFTVSEMVPSFFLRTSEVFTVSDSIVFWE